jgi:hypothetical protein
MRYFKIRGEGCYLEDWGGDPVYWLEVNVRGDAERQVEKYPNGNVLSYDRTHLGDEYGALAIVVVDGDPEFWEPHEISREEFEQEWLSHRPMNRPR